MSDVRGRGPRSQADQADRQGSTSPKARWASHPRLTMLPSAEGSDSEAVQPLGGVDGGVGSGRRGWGRAGLGVCWGLLTGAGPWALNQPDAPSHAAPGTRSLCKGS